MFGWKRTFDECMILQSHSDSGVIYMDIFL